MRVLEKKIERDFKLIVMRHGDECLKLATPGTRGLPDRIVIFDKGVSWFVEFKRPGGKLSPAQEFWIDVLRQKGFMVDVFDNLDEAERSYLEKRTIVRDL